MVFVRGTDQLGAGVMKLCDLQRLFILEASNCFIIGTHVILVVAVDCVGIFREHLLWQ